jgi:hypothetical protein
MLNADTQARREKLGVALIASLLWHCTHTEQEADWVKPTMPGEEENPKQKFMRCIETLKYSLRREPTDTNKGGCPEWEADLACLHDIGVDLRYEVTSKIAGAHVVSAYGHIGLSMMNHTLLARSEEVDFISEAFADAANVEHVAHARADAEIRIMEVFWAQGLFLPEETQCAA